MQRKKILTAVLGAALVAGVPVAVAQTGEGRHPRPLRSPTPPIVFLCDGQAPTQLGGPGADLLEGTPGVDVIAGFGGNDDIRGKGGNDVICGGPGTGPSSEALKRTRDDGQGGVRRRGRATSNGADIGAALG